MLKCLLNKSGEKNIHHPEHYPDERVQKEVNVEYAKVYPFFIALIIIATVAQLFITRFIIVYITAIIGGGGSLAYLIFKFHREKLFFNPDTDERIEEFKVNVKSKSYLFCLAVYIIGALPLLFFDVPILALWGISLTWFIPTSIAVIRIAKRGLYAPGSKSEAKSRYNTLRKSTAKSAIAFGIFMSLFMGLFAGLAGEFESIANALFAFAYNALLYAAFWGILFYFVMVGIDKISEKFGKKRLNSEDDTNDGENE